MATFPGPGGTVSFTRKQPAGALTIDALMARQKLAAARQQAALQEQQTTIPGGLGQMLRSALAGKSEYDAAQEEALGRQQLAQAISGIDPSTGIASPEQLSTVMGRDPDLGLALYQQAMSARQAQRQAELAAAQRTEDRQWRVEDREDTQQAAVDQARARAVADAAQPQTTQAKLAADLAANRIDQATYDAALKKANTSEGVTINTGDLSSALRKKFDEKEGEAWAGYLAAGNKAAAQTNDLTLLDELGKVAPQGPVPGTIASVFPSTSSAGAAFQSVIKRMAPQMRVEGSGATSDIEYQGMLDSLPKLQNYPEANRLISGAMRAKAEIDIARSDIVTQWRNGQMDDAKARTGLNDLNRRSIMSPELRDLIEATQAEQSGGAEGGGYTIEEIR